MSFYARVLANVAIVSLVFSGVLGSDFAILAAPANAEVAQNDEPAIEPSPDPAESPVPAPTPDSSETPAPVETPTPVATGIGTVSPSPSPSPSPSISAPPASSPSTIAFTGRFAQLATEDTKSTDESLIFSVSGAGFLRVDASQLNTVGPGLVTASFSVPAGVQLPTDPAQAFEFCRRPTAHPRSHLLHFQPPLVVVALRP